MHYAATGPGKRLRPALVLAAAAACGDDAQAMPAAIAIELLHAYTLVHDDLPAMDATVFSLGFGLATTVGGRSVTAGGSTSGVR
jgi:hypothetical protein